MAFWTKKSHQNFMCMKNFLRFEILQKDFIITKKYFSEPFVCKCCYITTCKIQVCLFLHTKSSHHFKSKTFKEF